MNFIKDVHFFIRVTGKNIAPIERGIIDFYHLTIVLNGKLTYMVNGQEIVVEENDALLLVPGTDRERLPYPDHADFIIFNFEPPKPNSFSSNIFFKNSVNQPIKTFLNMYPYKFYQKKEIGHYQGHEYRHYEIPEKTKVNAILHNIFNCIFIDLFDSLKYSTKNTHVINTLKYINDNITEPLTLNSVCNEVHLSKEYTSKVFKREMGVTVTQYINQQKLEIAKNLLLSNEFDLQSIAEKVGYQNYNYFSRIFKKNFGITPINMKIKMRKATQESALQK